MPKRTTHRYRVEAAPAKGSTWVRLARNHYAHGIVWATFTPLRKFGRARDPNRPIVQMLAALDETNRREIYAVHVSGDDPFTSTSMRLPLDAMARAALAACSYRLEGETAHVVGVPGDEFVIDDAGKSVEPNGLRELERAARRRPQRRAVTDDDLRRVAEIVREAPYRRRRAAVQKELKVSYAVAKSRIAEARRRGYIEGS